MDRINSSNPIAKLRAQRKRLHCMLLDWKYCSKVKEFATLCTMNRDLLILSEQ